MVLDRVIRTGQVIPPQGAGLWDVGVRGEQIAVVAAPGTLPTDAARVIDAVGQIVSPGGVEPHAHLAHGIMSHPEQPSITLGPEDDTRGMACGGTTTHLDFAYAPSGTDTQPAIEPRAGLTTGTCYLA